VDLPTEYVLYSDTFLDEESLNTYKSNLVFYLRHHEPTLSLVKISVDSEMSGIRVFIKIDFNEMLVPEKINNNKLNQKNFKKNSDTPSNLSFNELETMEREEYN